jgi:hypothetical protein
MEEEGVSGSLRQQGPSGRAVPQRLHTQHLTLSHTHIVNLGIGGGFAKVECVNLRARFCHLHGAKDKYRVRLENCVIGKLTIREVSPAYASRSTLELHGCWIGTLILPPKSVWRLSVVQGGIAQIECPSSDGENPFVGAVSFNKVFFPSSPTQTKLFQGPHGYRSLYAHLKKLDNTLMANQMRSHLLRSERANEQGLFSKFSNWVYDTFADYGMKPGRPVLWILGVYVLAVICCYYFDYGIVTQMHQSGTYVGANAALLDENGGRFTRSLLLPLQSVVNPFGVFFDSRKLFVPSTTLGSVLLTFQGLFSDVLLVMTALSIRRRYKAE